MLYLVIYLKRKSFFFFFHNELPMDQIPGVTHFKLNLALEVKLLNRDSFLVDTQSLASERIIF